MFIFTPGIRVDNVCDPAEIFSFPYRMHSDYISWTEWLMPQLIQMLHRLHENAVRYILSVRFSAVMMLVSEEKGMLRSFSVLERFRLYIRSSVKVTSIFVFYMKENCTRQQTTSRNVKTYGSVLQTIDRGREWESEREQKRAKGVVLNGICRVTR